MTPSHTDRKAPHKDASGGLQRLVSFVMEKEIHVGRVSSAATGEHCFPFSPFTTKTMSAGLRVSSAEPRQHLELPQENPGLLWTPSVWKTRVF